MDYHLSKTGDCFWPARHGRSTRASLQWGNWWNSFMVWSIPKKGFVHDTLQLCWNPGNPIDLNVILVPSHFHYIYFSTTFTHLSKTEIWRGAYWHVRLHLDRNPNWVVRGRKLQRLCNVHKRSVFPHRTHDTGHRMWDIRDHRGFILVTHDSDLHRVLSRLTKVEHSMPHKNLTALYFELQIQTTVG